MTPKIKKILYATDLSSNSDYAFRYAVNSAEKHDADVIILYVVEERAPFFDEKRLKEISDKKIAETTDLIKKRLKIFCNTQLKEYHQ